MKRTVTTVLLSVAACFSLSVDAAKDNSQLTTQRQQFQQAMTALEKNQTEDFNALRSRLRDYPLAIYLDYHAMTRALSELSQGQVVEFIQRAEDSPLSTQLHKKWLNHLASTQQWHTYLTQYAIQPLPDTHYLCHKLVAEMHTGNSAKALAEAPELWQAGYSQPKSCDPLFDAWIKQGHPTSAEANTRFWNALADDETSLAKYASRFVKDNRLKQQHETFWSLYNNPESLSLSSLQQIDKAHRATALELIVKRWFKQHPITATERWLALRDQALNRSEQTNINEYIGLRLNWRYHPDAIRFSQELDPDYSLPLLTESRIRNALQAEDWKAVANGIAHLPAEKKTETTWKYWALIAKQHIEPQSDVQTELKALSEDRSFYGFLAAELTGSAFQLNKEHKPFAAEALTAVADIPALKRARELYSLGRLLEANREWYNAKKSLSVEQQQLAAELAHSWGWHLQAIIIAAQTEDWDNISHRFPQPYANLFKTQAQKQGLDLSFPMAIARQESAFLSSAQSHAGARGLMQLMPATAKLTAKKHQVTYSRSSQLNDPITNVALGSAYLSDMMKKFDQNPAYAAAAYNAGPHRVSRWLSERGHLPLDVWIETIPFSETRKYVQNVLAYRVIYDRLDGRVAKLMTERQLAQVALNQSRQNR
ncbi:transglycosylase SLT domain-containing protein [Neptuniibacter sp. CAU 1671]|uniref:transglycosylase SLT domain-containing protein n=1 Tax=Neptuniibacter sp. CAU 1671 TaxID=3032593 RepID=UPI0023DAEC18|nr:transglycosylase SLT domain-containing protein [Neptuniibacter sp. CAU 1671]MDF2182913.1 transglycosylase SLT domain-containing protein [Neptuniibacter sp. CAU 1671]